MPTDHHDTLHHAGHRWYGRHLGEHLAKDRQRMVDRCALMLMDTYEVTEQRALEVSLQVLGDIESRGNRTYIDMDCTTSHMLFLVEPATGRRTAMTAADLARLSHIADTAAGAATVRAARSVC